MKELKDHQLSANRPEPAQSVESGEGIERCSQAQSRRPRAGDVESGEGIESLPIFGGNLFAFSDVESGEGIERVDRGRNREGMGEVESGEGIERRKTATFMTIKHKTWNPVKELKAAMPFIFYARFGVESGEGIESNR